MPDHSPAPTRGGRRRGRLAYAAVVAALALIGGATLVPVKESPVPLDHVCLLCGSLGLQDFLDNILLFLPLGVALRGVAKAGRLRAVLVAFVVTVVVEALQYKVIPGRDASVGDVVSNTLGAGVGVLLADGWRTPLFPAPPLARRLAIGGAALWLLVLSITAWALAPWPRPGRYDVQWAPADPRLAVYHGEVLGVALDGRAAPAGPLANVEATLERMRRRDRPVALVARVTTGNAREDFAPIARVMQVDEGRDSTELISIGERGCDLELRVRLRVAMLRMRGPAVAAPRVFPCGGSIVRSLGEPEGDTMLVAGALEGTRLRVSANGRGRSVTRSLALTPTLGWSFFLPWVYPFGGRDWPLSALWSGGLLFVVGYWAGRGGARWALPLLAASVVVGFAVLPLASGTAVSSVGEWAGSILGAGLGWWRGGVGHRRAVTRTG